LKSQEPLLILYVFVLTLMFGVGIATPILPLFASSLGASWTEIGLMGTSWGLTTALLATVGGRVSDKFGRKSLLIASASLSAAAAFCYLVSSSILQVILLRVLEGAAWAFFWPTVEALATELVEPKFAGRTIGIATISYAIAFGSSSLIGGAVAGTLGFKSTFGIYLTFSILSIIVLLVLRVPPRKMNGLSVKVENTSRLTVVSQPVVLAYILGITYTIGLGTLLTFFSVFAKGFGVTLLTVGGLFALFWAARIIGSYVGGWFSDKHGRGITAFGCMLGSTAGFAVIAVSNGLWLLAVGAFIAGLSIGATFPIGIALISDHINENSRGLAMGIFETGCGFGVMMGAAIGGLLADMYSSRSPYVMVVVVNLACAVLFVMKRATL